MKSTTHFTLTAAVLLALGTFAQAQPITRPDNAPANDQRIRPLAQDHVVVVKSDDPINVSTYDPGILALDDGRLIATYSFGGPGRKAMFEGKGKVNAAGEGLSSFVLTSDDGGETWTERAAYAMLHQRTFEAGDALYILGHKNDLRIMRSDDRGETWSEPVELTDGEVWHQSATSVWTTDTHVYLVMERRVPTGLKGWQVGNIAPVLMRGALDADLTQRDSWTFASELLFEDVVDQDELNYMGLPYFEMKDKSAVKLGEAKGRMMHPMGWLETNVVQVTDPNHVWYDPTGKTFHLLSRTNTGGTNYAALSKVVENEDGTMTTMLEQAPSGKDMVLFPLPGGHMKFYIEYDEQRQLYWMVGSQATDSMITIESMPPERFGIPNQERHRMVLHYSKNLVDWVFAGLVAEGPLPTGSRHYCSMDIDGDDLVIMSRSGDENAKDAHNGNLITFHRVENFRGLIY